MVPTIAPEDAVESVASGSDRMAIRSAADHATLRCMTSNGMGPTKNSFRPQLLPEGVEDV